MVQSKCGGRRPRTTLGSQFSVGSGITLRSQFEFYVLFTIPLNKINSKLYSKFFIHYHPLHACIESCFYYFNYSTGDGGCAHTYVQCESLWRPEASDPPAAGVSGNCELSSVSCGTEHESSERSIQTFNS